METNMLNVLVVDDDAGLRLTVKNTLSAIDYFKICLLYTSPSPRDQRGSRMPSSA